MLHNKRIFITGGAGFLGSHLISKYYGNNEITIYSRDEAKHYYIKKRFPKINCIIGDVRNYELLKKSSYGHEIGIFTASLKQIESVYSNIDEALQIIVHGALNSRKICEENGFESACFISSDKSRAATTIYGSMKFLAGESFIANSEKIPTRLSTAIYGNVLNSTGSIIPLIWNSIKHNYTLTLYSEQMTRFIIHIDEAIYLIERGLEITGCNVIPNLKAMYVKDLFEIYKENFGLKYQTGTPRESEKIHEMMISTEESNRTEFNKEKNIYMMHYKNIVNNSEYELTSDRCVVSKEQLFKILESNNFFQL
jgi:UDP-N-acetylglucosamine 4,6-dehydratase